MNATLQDARALFPNVAADTRAMSAEELLDAIRTKDGAKFDAASEKFTSECNSCHERVGLRFIKIRVPATSAFHKVTGETPTDYRRSLA